MSVERGLDWGEVTEFPVGGLVVDSDSALAAVVSLAASSGESVPPIALTGGDLHRTLGGPDTPARIRGSIATAVEIDAVRLAFDDREVMFVAHAIVGARPFGPGSVLMMNAQWFGPLDLAPRSHPGDGLLDVTTGSVPFAQRRQARRRARTGTHLPHPSLSERRVRSIEFSTDRPRDVRVDGVGMGRASRFEATVVPAAVRVWI